MKRIVVLISGVAMVLVGCNGPPPVEDTKAQQKAPAATAQMPLNPGGPAPDAPSKEVQPLKDAAEKARAAYEKSPKDQKLAVAYSKALTLFGSAIQNDPAFDFKSKYRQALQLFRKAVKLDPANKEAKGLIDQSESIYRSMNRPVPEALEPSLDLPPLAGAAPEAKKDGQGGN